MRWPSTLTARLTLWYTLLLALPLIAFASVCYFVVSRTLESRTDVFIGDALSAFARELAAERRSSEPIRESMQRTASEVRFRELHIAILDDSGRVVAMSPLADDEDEAKTTRRPSAATEAGVLAALRATDLHQPQGLRIRRPELSVRVLSRPYDADGVRYALTGAYALTDIDDVLQRLREMFQLAIPLLLIGAAFGGYALARRSLRPVTAMAAQAAAIGEQNLHERLPESGGDELIGLARVFNGLLNRLELSFDRQRRFIADASHELRTPTAVVRTEADVTLSRDHRDEDDYRGSVTIIRDAAQRLTRIVDDLFLLSRADSGHLVARPEPLYFEEVVDSTVRSLRSLAQQRGVELSLSRLEESPVVGDADLLGRLVTNLIDNAIKHAPAGTTVDASLSTSRTEATLSVVDHGAGIPVTEHERIFERFVRLDASRSRSDASATSGAGLGLAIARRIAELHRAQLTLHASRPGHTEFRLVLPLTTAPA